MNESELVEKIDAFTREHGKIPKQVSGSLKEMMRVMSFSGSFRSMNNKYYYATPFGAIEFVLSANADEVTLS